MTVRELIENLETYHPDLEAMVDVIQMGNDGDIHPISEIKLSKEHQTERQKVIIS